MADGCHLVSDGDEEASSAPAASISVTSAAAPASVKPDTDISGPRGFHDAAGHNATADLTLRLRLGQVR